MRKSTRTRARFGIIAAAICMASTGITCVAAPAHASMNPPADCDWNNGGTILMYGGYYMNTTQWVEDCAATSKTELVMQRDGNLVLYCLSWDSSGPHRVRAAWSSGTWWVGDGGRALFQYDGNLVVYTDSSNQNAAWSSNTWGHSGSTLALQDDSNLVIYDLNDYPIWSSNTYHAC